ncbi:unnamed protein product, partial [Prorocentrum cordatum]
SAGRAGGQHDHLAAERPGGPAAVQERQVPRGLPGRARRGVADDPVELPAAGQAEQDDREHRPAPACWRSPGRGGARWRRPGQGLQAPRGGRQDQRREGGAVPDQGGRERPAGEGLGPLPQVHHGGVPHGLPPQRRRPHGHQVPAARQLGQPAMVPGMLLRAPVRGAALRRADRGGHLGLRAAHAGGEGREGREGGEGRQAGARRHPADAGGGAAAPDEARQGQAAPGGDQGGARGRRGWGRPGRRARRRGGARGGQGRRRGAPRRARAGRGQRASGGGRGAAGRGGRRGRWPRLRHGGGPWGAGRAWQRGRGGHQGQAGGHQEGAGGGGRGEGHALWRGAGRV